MTLQCVIVRINPDNTTSIRDSVWAIAPDATLVTSLPNHKIVYNSTTGGSTDLVITNVILKDDNTVYTCDDIGATITSSVVLNVTGEKSYLCSIRMYICTAVLHISN